MKILQLGEDIWVDELTRALTQQGVETQCVPLSSCKHLNTLLQIIRDFKPDYTLGRNYYLFTSPNYALSIEDGLKLADFLAQNNITHLARQLDNPEASGSTELLKLWNQGFCPNKTIFLVADKSHLDFYKAKNIQAHFLGMAAPESYFDIKPSEQPDTELAFAGSPPPYPDFVAAPKNKIEATSFFAIREALDFQRTLTHIGKTITDDNLKQLYQAYLNFFDCWPITQHDYAHSIQTLLLKIKNITDEEVSHSGFMDMRFSALQLIKSVLHLQPNGIQVYGVKTGKNGWGAIKRNTNDWIIKQNYRICIVVPKSLSV